MKKLSLREVELVSLGAALGSNCSYCLEHHIPAARRAGLSNEEIDAAIRAADRVRQVPANKALATSDALLSVDPKSAPSDAAAGSCAAGSGCCG